jgi:alkylation response protein AidB-like acyl-CoA dehydrogenase
MLRDSLRSYLSASYGFEARSAAIRSVRGWRPQIWRELGELGILGAALPERFGGSGGGAVDVMVIMEELGAALVLEPYIECVVMAGGVLAQAAGARVDALLQAIVAGETIVILAWSEARSRYAFEPAITKAERVDGGWQLNGAKAVVVGAPWASHWLVTANVEGEGVCVFLVESGTAGVHRVDYPTVDGRRAADLIFTQVRLSEDALLVRSPEALPMLQRVGDSAIAAQSAEALGVLRCLHQDTVEYSKQRGQFGQALSRFQVLQHRMVDMHLHLEMATAATYLATLSLDAPEAERARAASTAKVTVAEACRFIGQNAVQLHGGVGMTEELRLGSYFKRATAIENEFGSIDYHLARHARIEASQG